VSRTYRLHSAHEMSPRARLRRSSGSDMALMDATRVRVAGIEVVATMRGEGGWYKHNLAEKVPLYLDRSACTGPVGNLIFGVLARGGG
jgi:hypothetical protein